MNNTIIKALFLLLPLNCFSQNTVGLISYDHEKSFDGYNLFYPHNQHQIYLINNCGEIVNYWSSDSMARPGHLSHLMENGDLILTGSREESDNEIHPNNGGDLIERRNWENDLIWQYYYPDSLERFHHDFIVLPNENIVMIYWQQKSRSEAILAGRDSNNLSQDKLWPEHILEIKPIGVDSAEIVWSWNVWDHLIQDFDSTKANFGVVEDHPERIDINYDNNDGKADWLHINSIDYNESLDQILLSVPFFNEIWIIDHSTTTLEASTTIGGNCNKGGDLLFRWGNPETYGEGDSNDLKLFFQHDAHWIDDHLVDGVNLDYGKIAVFNNRVEGFYSSVNIINPTFQSSTNSYAFSTTFLPHSFDWTYVHPDSSELYSIGLGGLQRLPNGNTLINSGRPGYIFEIDDNQNIVWEYENPFKFGNRIDQGSVLDVGVNLLFRMNRYPVSYPGFAGKDMTGKGYIETNPDTTFCSSLLSVDEMDKKTGFIIYPNPVQDNLIIKWSNLPIVSSKKISIYSLAGVFIKDYFIESNSFEISVSKFEKGIYFVVFDDLYVQKIIVQ